MRVVTRAQLPTRSGHYELVAFASGEADLPHLALVRGGDLRGAHDVPLRVHAECLTGDALGSSRCSCRAELEGAMDGLAEEERGVLLYLRQEGRGVGLADELRAFTLRDAGLATFEQNDHLASGDEVRGYHDAAAMLHALGIASVVFLTDDPKKLAGLTASGVVVASQRASSRLGRPSAA